MTQAKITPSIDLLMMLASAYASGPPQGVGRLKEILVMLEAQGIQPCERVALTILQVKLHVEESIFALLSFINFSKNPYMLFFCCFLLASVHWHFPL